MSIADIPDDPQAQLIDARDDLPLSVYYEIDDLPISPEAMRVYVHLIRRSAKAGYAWPSYQSIGDHCFRTGDFSKGTRRVYAIRAVEELVTLGLVHKKTEKIDERINKTNEYRITPRRMWKTGGGGNSQLPGGNPQLPEVNQVQVNQKPSRDEKKSSKQTTESPAFPSQEPLLTTPSIQENSQLPSPSPQFRPPPLPKDFNDRMLHMWNAYKYEGWTRHTVIPQRARSSCKQLFDFLKGDLAKTEEYVGRYVQDMAGQEWWRKKQQNGEPHNFSTLTSKGKLIEYADKVTFIPPKPKLDPIWNPASFKEGMRVWYCYDLFADKWTWATVVETKTSPDDVPQENVGFFVVVRKRDGEMFTEWNHNLAFKNPEET